MQTTFAQSAFKLPALIVAFFLTGLFNTAYSEPIDVTFYAAFDGGAVLTGRFTGTATEKSNGDLELSGDSIETLSVTVSVQNEDGSLVSRSVSYPASTEYIYTSLDGRSRIRWNGTNVVDLFFLVFFRDEYNAGSLAFNRYPIGPDPSLAWSEWKYPSGPYVLQHKDMLAVTPYNVPVIQCSVAGDIPSQGWLEEYIAAGSANSLIDNTGVADSLLTMVEAAGSAVANDNTQAAVRILGAFIHRVEGQSGHQIDPFMAELLINEATSVIGSLLE